MLGKYIVMGGTRLVGEVRVGGAKNSALPILAATLLVPGKSIIRGVPRLRDVAVMKEVLECLGASVSHCGSIMEVDANRLVTSEVPDSLTRKLRASNLVMGALLARAGTTHVAYPGGCEIGERPLDLHLKGFELLGARVEEKGGFIRTTASRLTGCDIYLDFPSVGATENLMLAATLAEGTTLIRNAAKEPEIVDLQNFLNSAGARVKGAGSGTVTVEGVAALQTTEHEIIPDRIEAETLVVAAAITGGDVCVTGVIPEHMEPVLFKLREIGARVETKSDTVRIAAEKPLRATAVRTLPYPGFPTDVQPQMMALLSVANGTSVISESIFENRFKHAAELKRLGADISVQGKVAVVKGVSRLSGAFVEASDLRAGVALIIAGLAADGITVVENAYHIERGYEDIERKLNGLGAKVIKVGD